MTFAIDLSPVQFEALASMRALLAPERWALIGASAIRCRIPMSRPTADVDFAVIASSRTIGQRFEQGGWAQHPRKLQTWQRHGAQVDVVPMTDEELLAGVADLGDGFLLSVIGFDLAFTETDLIAVREDLAVPVPRLAVLVLLKMVAWLERPQGRRKDLEDIVLMWDHALPDDDERRWDPSNPVCAAQLDYTDQSAFYCGWELGRIAGQGHLHWAKRFIDAVRDPDSEEFAQLVSASLYVGDEVELQVTARVHAFERGLEAGAVRAAQLVAPAAAVPTSTSMSLGWGHSGSLQMLLHDAIDQRRVVRFTYHGKERVGEPHVLGTKDGLLHLLTWQTDGLSSSGPLPDWRRFFVGEMRDVEVTERRFAGQRLTFGRHSAFDRQIVVVR